MQLIHPVSQIDADPKQNIKNSKKWIYLNLSLQHYFNPILLSILFL